jgi:hypothetical protein
MSERIVRVWEEEQTGEQKEETQKAKEIKEEDIGIILTRVSKIRLGNRILMLDVKRAEGIEIERNNNGYKVYVYFPTWQVEIEMDEKMHVKNYKTVVPEIPVIVEGSVQISGRVRTREEI